MFQVSNNAASLLANARTDQGLPEHVGVRISASPSPDGTNAVNLQLGFAEAPEPGDQITESEGTRVFVAPELADALDHAMLDTTEDSGKLILTDQAP